MPDEDNNFGFRILENDDVTCNPRIPCVCTNSQALNNMKVKIYLKDAKLRYKTTDVSELLPSSGCLNCHVK